MNEEIRTALQILVALVVREGGKISVKKEDLGLSWGQYELRVAMNQETGTIDLMAQRPAQTSIGTAGNS